MIINHVGGMSAKIASGKVTPTDRAASLTIALDFKPDIVFLVGQEKWATEVFYIYSLSYDSKSVSCFGFGGKSPSYSYYGKATGKASVSASGITFNNLQGRISTQNENAYFPNTTFTWYAYKVTA